MALAHVCDAKRTAGREFLVLVFFHVLTMHRDGAGEADQLPASLVAVAAVNRVGEHPLHHGLIERRPEHAYGQAALEGDLGGREAGQHLFALLFVEAIERLAIGFAAMRIGGIDAGAIKLRRRERQLIALARNAELPWALHVEPLALAPGARQRAIDEDIDPDLAALRSEVVGRDHMIDQRLDECRFLQVEEGIARSRFGRGRWRCGLCLRHIRRRGSRDAARDRTLQKIAAAKIFGHAPLPDNFPWVARCAFALRPARPTAGTPAIRPRMLWRPPKHLARAAPTTTTVHTKGPP